MSPVRWGKSRNRKVFLTLLLSYIIVLVIPISIGSIVYIRTGQMIAEDVSNSELTLLKQVRQTLDTGISRIRQMSWQISANSRIRQFLNVQKPLTVKWQSEGFCLPPR